MKVIKCENYDDLSHKGAEILIEVIKNEENPKLGLATGSTPLGMYSILVDRYKEGGLDFSKTETVNLDEYLGIKKDNRSSYHYYMYDKLFGHVNIDTKNVHIPEGVKDNINGALEDFDRVLDQMGRRHVQVLGVGENGHIAFNEPADSLHLRTSCIDLTPETIQVNSRFFSTIEEMPTSAITMGIADILNADHILLMINGEKKQDVVAQLLGCKMLDTHFPVSMLYTHPNVTLLVDKEAMAKVDTKPYRLDK